MVEIIESDILVEGEGITAAALAYFLSRNNPNKSINLILKETEGLNRSHFNPGILIPIFQFPDSQINIVFQRNIALLDELSSITQDFEFSQNPLLLLYRDKIAISKMSDHREKLINGNINHKILNLEEIESYYPFIKTEDEIHVTEIYKSYTCSNPYDLFIAFRKLAEENDVYIVREKERISLKGKKKLGTSSTEYLARELAFTTSNHNQMKEELRKSSLIRIVTPIFERFPKISIFDASIASFMWLEESGYFHIFRSLDRGKIKESIESIQREFEKTFAFSGELDILDASFKKIESLNKINNSLGYLQENDMYYLNIPPHFELSLSPIISDKISRLSEERLDLIKQPNAMFKIFKN